MYENHTWIFALFRQCEFLKNSLRIRTCVVNDRPFSCFYVLGQIKILFGVSVVKKCFRMIVFGIISCKYDDK